MRYWEGVVKQFFKRGTQVISDKTVIVDPSWNAGSWRGIAAAMGYEPKAHLNVRPTSPWILERIERFRAEVAREETIRALTRLREDVEARRDALRFWEQSGPVRELSAVMNMIDEEIADL